MLSMKRIAVIAATFLAVSVGAGVANAAPADTSTTVVLGRSGAPLDTSQVSPGLVIVDDAGPPQRACDAKVCYGMADASRATTVAAAVAPSVSRRSGVERRAPTAAAEFVLDPTIRIRPQLGPF